MIAVGATVLLWGSHGPVVKLLVDRLAWPVVVVVNTWCAVGFLTAFCAATGRLRHLREYTAKQYGELALAGAFGVFLYYALLLHSFAIHEDPVHVQVLNYLFPVMAVLFSAALVPGEALTVRRVVSVLVAFAGAYLVLTQGRPMAFRLTQWRGDLMALGAAASFGLFSALGKRFRYEPISGMLVFFAVGASLSLLLLPLAPALGLALRPPTWSEWLGLGYIGIASNCLGAIFWFRALRIGETAFVGSLVFLAVFVSLILFHVLLKQEIGPSAIVGTAVVVAGAVLASQRTRRRPATS